MEVWGDEASPLDSEARKLALRKWICFTKTLEHEKDTLNASETSEEENFLATIRWVSLIKTKDELKGFVQDEDSTDLRIFIFEKLAELCSAPQEIIEEYEGFAKEWCECFPITTSECRRVAARKIAKLLEE